MVMQVKFQQFFGNCHSWSVVGQSLAREFIKDGHDVDIFSTNGIQNYPEDLKLNLKGSFDKKTKIDDKLFSELKNNYDVQISYTMPRNFGNYLNRGVKNRFGIWAWEFNGINGANTLPPRNSEEL